jgi:hypothetical protein
MLRKNTPLAVTPAKAGAHNHGRMDTGLRRYDDKGAKHAIG